ncbi:hypothetical protein M8C21_000344 [Ambrosia artemisiifolia]|uniref:Small ribosomal subunit protein uS4 N-terminal domain-containing protein n=1 Tax=Ambrosia artemisiifolia TaxID=4212 RepID=A0AAD5CWK6_AMBAR|nr:hypothetical protein M8C21_000344 [Ambrosia artemisiifolia]
MVHVPFYRNYGKTFKKPRRPYEKERLDAELKLVGEYGLRCKRELWRVQYALSRIRNAARMLLTLEEKDPRRIFEGEALMRRMNRYGLLDESQNKLDYVLALTVENFLERRLQTLVFKTDMCAFKNFLDDAAIPYLFSRSTCIAEVVVGTLVSGSWLRNAKSGMIYAATGCFQDLPIEQCR